MTSKNVESSSWFTSSDGEILFIFYRINFDEVSKFPAMHKAMNMLILSRNLIVVAEMHNFNMAQKHGMVVTVDSALKVLKVKLSIIFEDVRKPYLNESWEDLQKKTALYFNVSWEWKFYFQKASTHSLGYNWWWVEPAQLTGFDR